MNRSTRRWTGLIAIAALLGAFFDVAADEHAGHHPGGDPAATGSTKMPLPPEATPSAPRPADKAQNDPVPAMDTAPIPGAAPPAPQMPAVGGGMGGGLGGGLGGMMGGMMGGTKSPEQSAGCMGGGCGGSAAKTPIYASLMTLPALTAEQRAEVEGLANQQTADGLALVASGSESLGRATRSGDNPAMHQAVGVMRQGLDELGAGIAARRVLAEGKAPRNLALSWFKREMNLSSPVEHDARSGMAGVTPFHLFTMALLIVFALIMISMYFFKMRRAAALFGRIEPVAGAPPGAAPPLKGDSAPPTPGAPPEAKATSPGAAGPATKSLAPTDPAGSPAARSQRVAAVVPQRTTLEPFASRGLATSRPWSMRRNHRPASRSRRSGSDRCTTARR